MVKFKILQMIRKLDLIRAPVDGTCAQTFTGTKGRAVVSSSYADLLAEAMREIPKQRCSDTGISTSSPLGWRDIISNY
jgi:hypothetical protein